MGKTHTIINDKGTKIRRQVLNQDGALYTKYNRAIWIVELDHAHPHIKGSKVIIKVYRFVRKATLTGGTTNE